MLLHKRLYQSPSKPNVLLSVDYVKRYIKLFLSRVLSFNLIIRHYKDIRPAWDVFYPEQYTNICNTIQRMIYLYLVHRID